MRENFDEKRLVHLAGDETAPWDLAELAGTDLTTFIDVRVKEGSTTRRNVAAQRSNILELLQSAAAPALTQLAPMQQGVVLSRILQAMDLGDLGVLYDQTGLDAQNARYEQKMMEKGVDMPLTPEENPLVHLQVHGDDIKSATTQGGDDVALAQKRKHFQMTQEFATLLLGGPPGAPGAAGGGEKGTEGPAKPQKPPVG